ncbi:MAG: hypothetical protein K2X87_13825 [Gemmataceae bacterium]|nr:hypothetical protein [Gemmataceae bacterium]
MLDRNTFVVKERVKLISNTNTYDILDGESGEPVGTAEENIGPVVQLLRFFISKHIMPTRIEVREKPDDSLVFTIRRGAYIFKSRVEVHDAQGELLGYFKSKFFTISGGFHIYDKDDKHFAEIKGKWLGWDYRFLTPDGQVEMGRVSKKLGALGLVKELFTSADTYAVAINPELADEPLAKMLVLAAALAIDTIYKEESRTVGIPGLDE